ALVVGDASFPDKPEEITAVKTLGLRHTFLTRLGASGCDAWTLARIAGHSSVAISSRYVHPSDDNVLAAVNRLGGHNFGHNGNSGEKRLAVEPLLSSSNDLSKVGRGERI